MPEEKRSSSGLLTTDELQALRRSARRSLAILAMHFKLVPRWKGDSIVWSGRHACHVRLTGKVQGVGFRAWVREQAKQALVGGWVRNCADGSVEVHLEGSRDEVESIVERLRDGPAGARPANVQIEGAGVEYLTRFEVRY